MTMRNGFNLVWVRWIALLGSAALAGCTADAPFAGPDRPATPLDPSIIPSTYSCAAGGDPGRVSLHRLNRAEYNLTVRDLLGDTTAPAGDFPVDESSAGFDNNADVLSV